jgi:ParB-like chromosome segregation protein Spo0J
MLQLGVSPCPGQQKKKGGYFMPKSANQAKDAAKEEIIWLPVDLLDNYPGSYVFGMDDEDTQRLVASIKSCGKILEPLTVMPNGHRYTIVAGNNRHAAAKILGHDTVPCRLLPEGVDPDEAFLVTNLTRRNKTHMQIARAVRCKKANGLGLLHSAT